jgi:hypothetical protein
MSDKSEKPMGLPPYYWAKPPVKVKPAPKGFVNKQQKKFFAIRTGFMLAKVAAAATLALLILSRI